MENHFTLAPNEYGRDLNVLKHYVNDAALYLQKRTGKPYQTCVDYVIKKTGREGDMGITDPDTLVLAKETDGQREERVIPFSEYLKDVEVNNRIISPTMAVYHNADDKKSLLSEFISQNIARRSQSKKEKFAAKQAGNKELEEFKENEQKSFKINNNGLSGAQASTGTMLYNESAHSSLTSTCRTATSYGNANNEKFLFGNRHYWHPEIVKANILSVVRSSNYDLIEKAMENHGIRHPTVEETMSSIVYSTHMYWSKDTWQEDENLIVIRKLVESLTPIERSAFVYTGDFYHLREFNKDAVYNFLDRLSTKASEPIDNPDEYIGAMDDDLKAFVSLLCYKEIGGSTIKDLKEKDAHGYAIVGATAKAIIDCLDDYQFLIKGFWRANTMPASISHIRDSVRRGVITSDTDSTIFTVQDWTSWFVGQVDFSEKSNAISYAVVYLATQTIAHILAMVSGGMGVEEEMIHDLSMKNEFAFPVFTLTSMAKHYFAYISACEGNVYSEYDVETKGVGLKDSNCPPHVMDEFNTTLRWTMDRVIDGTGVNITELLNKVATLEHGVMESVKRGESLYLTGAQVKNQNSYKNPESSPYVHYQMWEEVFAPKYGHAPEPPYSAVKVSIDIKNPTALNEWLDNIEDQELAQRMRDHLRRKKKKMITSLLLPRPLIALTGLPPEIVQAINLRKLVFSTVRPFYFLLESLGFYMVNDNITRLVSDHHEPTKTFTA